MIIRTVIAFVIVASATLSGCASSPRDSASLNPTPLYDGIYRLSYTSAGTALYYRFYPDGVVVSARSDAPANEIYRTLSVENADTSRGTWRAENGELRVGVEEGTVAYDSRFDIHADGRIVLRGFTRSFDFLRTDDAGNVIATR